MKTRNMKSVGVVLLSLALSFSARAEIVKVLLRADGLC